MRGTFHDLTGVASVLRKYAVILADPPWSFQARSHKGEGRSAKAYYDTLTIEAIAALPVGDLAAKDCALFLWANTPLLDRMPQIMQAWGFTYKSTGFVWVKCNKDGVSVTRLGQGYGTRKQSELCLLGTRGNPKCRSRRVREVTISPRRAAHQKPDLYPEIEQLFTGPYVELFARQRWPGWDVAFSREADTGPAPRRYRSNSYQGKTPTNLIGP